VTPRSRSLLSSLLVVAVLVLASGCRLGDDDEMVPPTRTVTASPSPRVTAVPSTIPVGDGKISPSDAVWAQDSVLHVGTGQVDLAPRRVDSFVVVPGGLYFVDHDQLWFTDLVRVRDTGLRGVTGLATNKDGSAIRVELSGPASVHAYDSRDGSSLSPDKVVPVTVADRLGSPVAVSLRSERSDASSPPPAPGRRGPGRYGVLGGDGEPLVGFVSATRVRVPLTGVVGDGFELVRWTSGSTVVGLARAGAKPLAVIRCDLAARSCTTLGKVVSGDSLVFESGT
jgi:hypothetical protein